MGKTAEELNAHRRSTRRRREWISTRFLTQARPTEINREPSPSRCYYVAHGHAFAECVCRLCYHPASRQGRDTIAYVSRYPIWRTSVEKRSEASGEAQMPTRFAKTRKSRMTNPTV